MKTICFYSYKGGTGRSLALVNTAYFLALNGLSVFVLDLDLEAPGLKYKFEEIIGDKITLQSGFIDYVKLFMSKSIDEINSSEEDVSQYKIKINSPNFKKPIYYIPAGKSLGVEYCKDLLKLNSNELMLKWIDGFNDSANNRLPIGATILNRLSRLISKSLEDEKNNPDYLLIDCRTGITSMGLGTLFHMSDKVVLFTNDNNENMDGTNLIKSLIINNNTKKLKCDDILTVWSRLPEKKKLGVCSNDIKSNKVNVSNDFHILYHSDHLLNNESILLSQNESPKTHALLGSYYKLFKAIGINKNIKPNINKYINLVNNIDYPEIVSRNDNQYITWEKGQYNFFTEDKSILDKIKTSKDQTFYILPDKNMLPDSYLDLSKNIKNVLSCYLEKAKISKKCKKIKHDNVSWCSVTDMLSNGSYHFWGEPYYLTESRSNSLSVLQIGTLQSFTAIYLRDNIFDNIKNRNIFDHQSISNLVAHNKQLAVGILPDTAASDEIIKLFSQENISSKISIIGPEYDLLMWLIKEPAKRVLFVDKIIASSMKKTIDGIKSKLDLSEEEKIIIDYDFNILDTEDTWPEINYRLPLPVGFMYPRKDFAWRRVIAKSIISAYDNKKEFKIKWDNIKKDFNYKFNINILDFNDFWLRLKMDLNQFDQYI